MRVQDLVTVKSKSKQQHTLTGKSYENVELFVCACVYVWFINNIAFTCPASFRRRTSTHTPIYTYMVNTYFRSEIRQHITRNAVSIYVQINHHNGAVADPFAAAVCRFALFMQRFSRHLISFPHRYALYVL